MYDILVMEAVREEEIAGIGVIENLFRFRFGPAIRAIYQENLLAQKFVKMMFTNPTDENPQGGGILPYVPETFNRSQLGELKTKMTVVVAKTETDIIQEQIGTTIPDQERLLKATLIDVIWNERYRWLSVLVRVTALTGDSWVIRVPLAEG